MIVASIDIGTNTVLLLIAELNIETGSITSIKNEYRIPRIGQGVKKSGVIKNEKIALLLKVISEYDEIISCYDCNNVILTGTNAFRIAGNSVTIVKQIKDRFGYNLNIISGEEEAEYAYLGAISGFDSNGLLMVIDIGGSSTEFITGHGKEIISKKSLQLGSVSLTEQFLHHSPPLNSELENLRKEIRDSVSTINIKSNLTEVVAIAGTATTIVGMINNLNEFDEIKVENSLIEIQSFNGLVQQLNKLTADQILERFGPLLKGREDIILAGAYVLLTIMEVFKIQSVKVSTRGIRFGAIVKYFRNLAR